MSSVQSALANQPRRQYVTAAAFNLDFFTYTLTTNPTTNVTTGAISANVTGADSTTCPAGRILRENGQKLYPGVNVGVPTFMVGVVDTATLLSGYIDPNSPIFAVYSTALPFGPIYGSYPTIQYNGVDPGPGGLPDEGPPVFTNGNIICVSGNISTQSGSITSATTVLATTGIGYSSGLSGFIAQGTSKATTVILNTPVGDISMNAAALASQTSVTFTLTNSLVDLNDVLALTHTTGGTVGAYTLNSYCNAVGSAAITVRNITGVSLSEAIGIRYLLLKG